MAVAFREILFHELLFVFGIVARHCRDMGDNSQKIEIRSDCFGVNCVCIWGFHFKDWGSVSATHVLFNPLYSNYGVAVRLGIGLFE